MFKLLKAILAAFGVLFGWVPEDCKEIVKKERKWKMSKEKWEITEIRPDGNLIIKCGQPQICAVVNYACLADNAEKKTKLTNEAEANACRICQCVNGWDELQAQRDALLEACKMVYADIELQNVKGGSNELNFIVQRTIELAEKGKL